MNFMLFICVVRMNCQISLFTYWFILCLIRQLALVILGFNHFCRCLLLIGALLMNYAEEGRGVLVMVLYSTFVILVMAYNIAFDELVSNFYCV
jgi:hypothetical protein